MDSVVLDTIISDLNSSILFEKNPHKPDLSNILCAQLTHLLVHPLLLHVNSRCEHENNERYTRETYTNSIQSHWLIFKKITILFALAYTPCPHNRAMCMFEKKTTATLFHECGQSTENSSFLSSFCRGNLFVMRMWHVIRILILYEGQLFAFFAGASIKAI